MQNQQKINSFLLLFLSGAISIYYVIFLWRFWSYGIEALGINVTIFWILLISFYIWIQRSLNKCILFWLIPFTIIVLSLSIYTTPFTGWISILLLPVLFFIFTTHESHKYLQNSIWSKFMPLTLLLSMLCFFQSIIFAPKKPFKKNGSVIDQSSKEKMRNIIFQVLTGVIFLFVLSVVVIIPLLSSADSSFANIFKNLLDWLKNIIINFKTLPWKLTIAILGTLMLIGASHYWQRTLRSFFKSNVNKTSSSDNSIILGIILSGILVLYLLFIGIQIHTLFINNLPVNFTETESLVKSGFWQLFALTILNILFYILVYRKSTKNVQLILAMFTLTSLLLIISATHRVFLYVTTYGLSFEKFFAFYTVIFCIIVFTWFLSLFAYSHNKPIYIIRNLVFLALWMYALTTIIPLERIIFNTNLKLTQQENSRIDLNELKMLGFDALPLLEENFDTFIKEAQKDYRHQYEVNNYGLIKQQNYTEKEHLQNAVDLEWLKWIKKNEDKQNNLRQRRYINCRGTYNDYAYSSDCKDFELATTNKRNKPQKKAWYEKTFIELIYTPTTIKKTFESIKKEIFDTAKIKTFKNDVHGFSIEYPTDIFTIDSTGDHIKDIDKLLNDDYTLKVKNRETNDYVQIIVYNKNALNPSKGNSNLRRWIIDNKGTEIKLPNLSETLTQTIAYTQHQKLLINLPQKIFVIESSHKIKSDKKITSLSSEEYINLVAPLKELADVIKSFKLIETKKY